MQVQLESDVERKYLKYIKKIVVISDTHIPVRAAAIPNEILEECKTANLIMHAGDFQTMEVIHTLEKYGPVIGVFGNTDSDDVLEYFPERLVITITNNGKEFKIGMMHGFGAPQGLPERVFQSFKEKLDCIIFGHSHTPLNGLTDGTLLFNPGSPTDRVFTTINTFGILRLADKIKGEIHEVK